MSNLNPDTEFVVQFYPEAKACEGDGSGTVIVAPNAILSAEYIEVDQEYEISLAWADAARRIRNTQLEAAR